ncbi:MAG: peptidoglycan-binding protein [Granulosicoccus sp.]|nr:peptidoglycan-binding protein [Granulosicoccus sp.]
MSAIYIGHCDAGCVPAAPASFLAPFHNVAGSKALKNRVSFRDDDRSTWRRFKEISNATFTVSDIHSFLHAAGFMPRERQLPVFDYVTQSAIRLFQEYLRSIEGHAELRPDGIVGQQTYQHMKRWEREGKVCTWAAGESPSDEYITWLSALNRAKSVYADKRPDILKQVDDYPGKSDTRKLDDWTFGTDDIHLIGLRSGENLSEKRRRSNDIFVLLINGLVFKFWGSTDPSTTMTSRSDEAFLVEGQHKYRFSWHKVSDASKIYRALRPYQHGVLVCRDRDGDDALTDADVAHGLDATPNPVINIHWSGIGSANWSAGCQVIAGRSYINPTGDVIDCSSFAATGYRELNREHRKTKGAYNMLADLVLCYAPPSVDYLLYTLGRDESLLLSESFDADYLQRTFASMQV